MCEGCAGERRCVQAARLTMVQLLINSKGLQMNPLQSLYYVSPACFICLSIPFGVRPDNPQLLYHSDTVTGPPAVVHALCMLHASWATTACDILYPAATHSSQLLLMSSCAGAGPATEQSPPWLFSGGVPGKCAGGLRAKPGNAPSLLTLLHPAGPAPPCVCLHSCSPDGIVALPNCCMHSMHDLC